MSGRWYYVDEYGVSQWYVESNTQPQKPQQVAVKSPTTSYSTPAVKTPQPVSNVQNIPSKIVTQSSQPGRTVSTSPSTITTEVPRTYVSQSAKVVQTPSRYVAPEPTIQRSSFGTEIQAQGRAYIQASTLTPSPTVQQSFASTPISYSTRAIGVPVRVSNRTPVVTTTVLTTKTSYVTEPIRTYAAEPSRTYVTEPTRSFTTEPIRTTVAEPTRTYITEPTRTSYSTSLRPSQSATRVVSPSSAIYQTPSVKKISNDPINTYSTQPIQSRVVSNHPTYEPQASRTYTTTIPNTVGSSKIVMIPSTAPLANTSSSINYSTQPSGQSTRQIVSTPSSNTYTTPSTTTYTSPSITAYTASSSKTQIPQTTTNPQRFEASRIISSPTAIQDPVRTNVSNTPSYSAATAIRQSQVSTAATSYTTRQAPELRTNQTMYGTSTTTTLPGATSYTKIATGSHPVQAANGKISTSSVIGGNGYTSFNTKLGTVNASQTSATRGIVSNQRSSTSTTEMINYTSMEPRSTYTTGQAAGYYSTETQGPTTEYTTYEIQNASRGVQTIQTSKTINGPVTTSYNTTQNQVLGDGPLLSQNIKTTESTQGKNVIYSYKGPIEDGEYQEFTYYSNQPGEPSQGARTQVITKSNRTVLGDGPIDLSDPNAIIETQDGPMTVAEFMALYS